MKERLVNLLKKEICQIDQFSQMPLLATSCLIPAGCALRELPAAFLTC